MMKERNCLTAHSCLPSCTKAIVTPPLSCCEDGACGTAKHVFVPFTCVPKSQQTEASSEFGEKLTMLTDDWCKSPEMTSHTLNPHTVPEPLLLLHISMLLFFTYLSFYI